MANAACPKAVGQPILEGEWECSAHECRFSQVVNSSDVAGRLRSHSQTIKFGGEVVYKKIATSC